MPLSMLNEVSMKQIIYSLFVFFLLFVDEILIAQDSVAETHEMKVNLIVDASCAKCQFGKESDDECLLAVEINSEIYYVEGTSIDDHGDAHSSDGFCNSIRKAHVEGIIDRDKFLLEKFSLLKYRPKKKLYSN